VLGADGADDGADGAAEALPSDQVGEAIESISEVKVLCL
jgi:hypothetical protein